MANQIKVDVKVDDKGTTKKVGLEAKKTSENLNETAKSSKNLDRNMKGVTQQSANTTKNFSKMSQGMGGLVAIYATIAAQVFAVSAAFEFFKAAADLRVLKDSQVAYSSATGIGLQSLTKDIKAATDGMVGYKDAAQAAAIGVASGLSTAQIENLAAGAKNVSLLLGRDVTDSFNRLVRGVTKAEPELLDELGITLRLADATEKYAASINKNVKELSLYEKSQAIAVEVQDQLDKKYASVAASVELQTNAVTKLGTAFEKVTNPIREVLSSFVEPSAEFLTNNIKALTAALALLAIPVVKQIIPGLSDWATTAQESAAQASAALAEARAEMEALKQAQAELNQAGQDPRSAAQAALNGVKSKSSGITKLQSGTGQLTDREIKGLLRAAEAGKGAVTSMSKEMRRQYIAALREMAGESKTTSAKINNTFQTLKTSLGLKFKQIGVMWDATMAKMKKAAATFSSYANKAMKLAGFVGLILLVKDLAVEISQKFGMFKQDKTIEELAQQFDQVIDKLRTANKEFSKFAEIQKKFYEKNADLTKPNADGLAAIGNLISSNTSTFSEQFELMDKYNGMLKMTEAETSALTAAEKKLEAAQAAINRTLELRAKFEKEGDSYRAKNTNVTSEQAQAVKNAEQEIAAAMEGLRRRQEELNPSALEEYGLSYENVGEKVAEAQQEIKASAAGMAASLRAAKVETQEGGKDLLDLLDILKTTGTLTATDREKFDRLAKGLVNIGTSAGLAQARLDDLNRSFSKKMSSITEFTTSVTDSINQYEDLRSMYSKGGLLENEANSAEKIKEINEKLKVLNNLREQEIGLQLRSLRLELQKEKGIIGATKREQEALNRALKLADIESKRLDIQNKLKLAADATDVDQAKIEALMLQLDILNAQEEAIRRQQDVTLDTIDKMNDAFEGSFQSGLADLIKGKESSLKNVAAKIATSTLEAAADNLAGFLTDQILNRKKETPEEKMKNAMMEGGAYAAEEIRAAIEGRSSTNTGGGEAQGAAAKSTGGGVWSSVKKLGSDLWGSTGTRGENQAGNKDAEGREEILVVPGRGLKGLFNDLTLDFKELFSKDTPFLEGLGNLFANFGSNIGGLFTTLLGGLSGIFSSLFGSATSTASQVGMTFLSAVFSGMAAGAGTAGGTTGGTTTVPGTVTPSAPKIYTARYGGVFSDVPGYAVGGIAKGPQSGYPVTMHGTEAIVPLPNNKSIPVDLKGGGQQNNVTVNVSIASDGSKREDKQSDSTQGANLGTAIAAAVQQELQNQKRSGGILSPYGVA